MGGWQVLSFILLSRAGWHCSCAEMQLKMWNHSCFAAVFLEERAETQMLLWCSKIKDVSKAIHGYAGRWGVLDFVVVCLVWGYFFLVRKLWSCSVQSYFPCLYFFFSSRFLKRFSLHLLQRGIFWLSTLCLLLNFTELPLSYLLQVLGYFLVALFCFLFYCSKEGIQRISFLRCFSCLFRVFV